MPFSERVIKSAIFTDTEFDYEFVFFPKASRSKGDLPKTDTRLQIVERKARKGYVNALRNRLQVQLEANKSVARLGEGKECRFEGCAGGKSPRFEGSSSKQTKKRVRVMESNFITSGKNITFPYTRPGIPLAEYMRLSNKAAELQQDASPRCDEETVTKPENHSPIEPSLSEFAMDIDDPSELTSTVTIAVTAAVPPSMMFDNYGQITFDSLALVPVTPLYEEPMEVDYPPLVAEIVHFVSPPPPYSEVPQDSIPPNFTVIPVSASAHTPTGGAPLTTITNTTPKLPAAVPEPSTSTPNPVERAISAHRDARQKEQMAKRREIRGLPTRRGARTGAPTNDGQHRAADGQCSSSKGTAAPNEKTDNVQKRNGCPQTRPQASSSKHVPREPPVQPSNRSKAAGFGKGSAVGKGKNQGTDKQQGKKQIQKEALDKIWEEADVCRGLMEFS